MTQRKFWLVTALWASSAYLLLVGSFWLSRDYPVIGSLLAVFAIYVASPIAMWRSATKYERRSFREVFDLKIGSWAFLIGDTVVLPLMAVFMTSGWHEEVPVTTTVNPSLVLGCLGVGVLVGGLFHWLDGLNYKSAGAEEALDSPTKITHDFCAYPVLFGGLIYGAIPLVQNWGLNSWYAVGCLIAWLLLCARDAKANLNPKLLHPRWNKLLFRPLKWLGS